MDGDKEKSGGKKVKNDAQLNALASLLQLSTEVQSIETIEELGFAIVNDTKRLINYNTAILWKLTPDKNVKIANVSGVPDIESDAPFVSWCKRFTVNVQDKEWRLRIQPVSDQNAKDLGIDEEIIKGWSLFAPPHILYCPLKTVRGHFLGGLLLLRDFEWQPGETVLIERLLQTYSFAWWALTKHTKKRISIMSRIRKKKFVYSASAAFVLLMLMPIRLSVLAPAQIIPKDPFVVSAPVDGAVARFHVAPNEKVEPGQNLFSLDDTTIRNNFEVAKQALNVAKAEYRKAAQQALTDAESKAKLAVLEGEIQRREAELAYNQELLERITIKADHSGVAVFDNPNDWIGRPVSVGERVMQLADANKVEIEVFLAVDDAMYLSEGADVRLFLNVDPLNPVHGELKYTSYEAIKSPSDILSYRLLADINFDKEKKIPRIGLKGTAKVYGERVTVFYYLMRRPIYVVRRFLGI